MNRPDKVIWVDTETTGTDKDKNGLVQLAAVMEIKGKVVDEIELKIKPFKGQICTGGASSITGFTVARLRSDEFIPPEEAHRQLLIWLNRHIAKRDKTDKAYIGGQNVHFDVDFIASWFDRLGDKYLGSWWNWRRLDSLNLAHVCGALGLIDVPNYKLETLAGLFDIELKAHDAVSDIKVSRLVFYRLLAMLQAGERVAQDMRDDATRCQECKATTVSGDAKHRSCWLCGWEATCEDYV